MGLAEELKNLESVKVDTVVVHKKKNNLISRLIGGPYGGVFCKTINPKTGKEFVDYIRVTKQTYYISKIGDILTLSAYKGMKDRNQIYLRPDEALVN